MVALVKCLACRNGDCARCEGGKAAPQGMLGGTQCPCEGKCERQPDPLVEVVSDELRRRYAEQPRVDNGEDAYATSGVGWPD